jgi:xylulokinase
VQVLGHLAAEAAEQLGLLAGLVVAPGSGDNTMSALGAGAVR